MDEIADVDADDCQFKLKTSAVCFIELLRLGSDCAASAAGGAAGLFISERNTDGGLFAQIGPLPELLRMVRGPASGCRNRSHDQSRILTRALSY